MSLHRLTRPIAMVAAVLVLVVGLTVAAAALLGGGQQGDDPRALAPAAADRRGGPGGAGSTASADVGAVISALQARLRAHPRDAQGWAGLGSAYVEQARISADPTYYTKADQVLAKASSLAPSAAATLTSRAILASARHQFAAALRLADRAIGTDPYSAQAYATRADALTELGHYPAALTAATRADNLRPDSSTFARLSYAAELRGRLTRAGALMRHSQQAAAGPPSYAFAAFHLGELARAQGHLPTAARRYADALHADPTYAPALAGRARVAVARGDIAAAVRDYRTVVGRLPLTEYVVELGELYLATGRPALAEQQWSVARASAALAKANGVVTDLETALFEADHGSPTAALAAARSEWGRRHSIHVADSLGWALHATGQDRAALRYARFATRLGTPDARMLFHLGAVEARLGRSADARSHLRAALRLDAGVSPWRDHQARALLGRTGGAR